MIKLDSSGKSVKATVIAELDRQHRSINPDSPILNQYCLEVTRWEHAESEITRLGSVIHHKRAGMMANPYIEESKRARAEVDILADRLGINNLIDIRVTRSAHRAVKYKSEMCDRVPVLMAQGMGVAEVCGELGIHRDTWYQWKKKYKDFNDAIRYGKVYHDQCWERVSREGAFGVRSVNTSLVIFNLKNRLGYRDQPEDISSDESPPQLNIYIGGKKSRIPIAKPPKPKKAKKEDE